MSVAVAALPPLLTGAEWTTWLYRGLALLLIGCPCALVLSVPAAITSALAAGARRGLLVKGARRWRPWAGPARSLSTRRAR